MKKRSAEKQEELVERERVLAAQNKDIETKAKALEKEYAELEKQKAALSEEQRKFVARKMELDSDFASKKAADTAALEELKANKLAEIEKEVSDLRDKRLKAIADAENRERDRIRNEIANEQQTWDVQKTAERNSLDAERAELVKERAAVEAIKKQNEITKAQNDQAARSQKDQFDWQQNHIREQQENIEAIIRERVEDKRREFDSILAAAKDTQHDLTSQILSQQKMLAMYDQIKAQLDGEDAAKVLRDLNSARDELTRLRDELMTRPTEEMRLRYETQQRELTEAKSQIEKLVRERDSQRNDVEEVADLRFEVDRLKKENSRLTSKADSCDKARIEAEEELKRYQMSHERKADRDARIQEIEIAQIAAEKIGEPPHSYKRDAVTKAKAAGKSIEERRGLVGKDEMAWLDGIYKKCTDYGLVFPQRILRSFHTALKTAEWSPLTILAGVSGTGKSELPRLYSHFGGLFFEPLSVQPNWDSKESMLGFFNSIDNKFDAQPLLRFLAQSQKAWVKDNDKVYPGLKEGVCLVLLDEMNLAHPELYFAEFLSKLELRRGMKGTEVPALPVNVGAGMEAYDLPLGRNVLWTGTMNQDETTKSLSDKVLDRSIVISFPRPTELLRRKALMPLDAKNRGELLHVEDWQSWLAQDSAFTDDEIKPYRKTVEKINASLGLVGRALGHRVWQSIEYYMANYPTVAAAKKANDDAAWKEAMDTAFEDQIVQKIMPKLRGIDTRGTGAGPKCLSEIFGMIPDTLKPDFDFARDKDLSYGQFKWQTAKYLEEKSIETDEQGQEDSAESE
ncbi:MAG: chromosome partitioning protein ParA [Kiritimatiellae bacterium]|nr:chromosome partitioning protein ParA [Kiritimatiellia bacterium]